MGYSNIVEIDSVVGIKKLVNVTILKYSDDFFIGARVMDDYLILMKECPVFIKIKDKPRFRCKKVLLYLKTLAVSLLFENANT